MISGESYRRHRRGPVRLPHRDLHPLLGAVEAEAGHRQDEFAGLFLLAKDIVPEVSAPGVTGLLLALVELYRPCLWMAH